jgi:hypothetical protein
MLLLLESLLMLYRALTVAAQRRNHTCFQLCLLNLVVFSSVAPRRHARYSINYRGSGWRLVGLMRHLFILMYIVYQNKPATICLC